MTLSRLFKVPELSTPAAAAVLLIRLVAGLAFMMHGWGKIQNPTGWMGPDAFAPGFLQALAAVSEFGGGLAWILGLLTPLASLGIFSTMAVATYTHMVMKGDPFVGSGGSYELSAVYLCLALVLIAVGPGQISADHKIFGRR